MCPSSISSVICPCPSPHRLDALKRFAAWCSTDTFFIIRHKYNYPSIPTNSYSPCFNLSPALIFSSSCDIFPLMTLISPFSLLMNPTFFFPLLPVLAFDPERRSFELVGLTAGETGVLGVTGEEAMTDSVLWEATGVESVVRVDLAVVGLLSEVRSLTAVPLWSGVG